MADKQVVRQDVVQIKFDVDSKALEALNTNLDVMQSNSESCLSDISTNLTQVSSDFEDAGDAADGFAASIEKAADTNVSKELDAAGKRAKALNEYFEYTANLSFDEELKKIKTNLASVKDGLDKASDSVLKLAKNAAGKGVEGLKKMASVSFKSVIAGITAIGAGAVAATQAYADYEQNVGGIETLFKDDASTVLKNANDAYKNAGLSANEYMETVTGFSASLISSLSNDTAKAAEYADLAITDMADNANKMGTDMESIMNAYQGFAKQTYTMLDNLKLGRIHHCRAA